MKRINLVNGVPEVADTSDFLWAEAENNGWRVYAAYGESKTAVCSRFVKAPSSEEAVDRAANPFGDLSTGGWRRED